MHRTIRIHQSIRQQSTQHFQRNFHLGVVAPRLGRDSAISTRHRLYDNLLVEIISDNAAMQAATSDRSYRRPTYARHHFRYVHRKPCSPKIRFTARTTKSAVFNVPPLPQRPSPPRGRISETRHLLLTQFSRFPFGSACHQIAPVYLRRCRALSPLHTTAVLGFFLFVTVFFWTGGGLGWF